MASDREEAKSHIVTRDNSDAELESVLGSANRFQLDITREQNRNQEANRDKDLGVFGRFIGGEKIAPVVVAMIVVLIGFSVGIGCLVVAIYQEEKADFWSKQAERGFGVGSAALAYIFGKGSN